MWVTKDNNYKSALGWQHRIVNQAVDNFIFYKYLYKQ